MIVLVLEDLAVEMLMMIVIIMAVAMVFLELWSLTWWWWWFVVVVVVGSVAHLLRQRSFVMVSLSVKETRGSTAMSCTEASIGEMKKYRLPAACDKTHTSCDVCMQNSITSCACK